MLDTFAEGAAEEPKETMSEASERGHFSDYIHLEHVSINNASGQSVVLENFLWRGRIERVDGFAFGKMNSQRR